MSKDQEFNFDLNSADNNGERIIYTVSKINEEIKEILEGAYPIVWIEGEISGFKSYNSGHFYFNLKDKKSQIRAVMFSYSNNSLTFEPNDGMKVLVLGHISAYTARGDYQIIVERMEQIGIGDLYKEFEKLKNKLSEAGFFDESYKKEIPALINKVGIVTSQDGAALHDMLKVFEDLEAGIEILICPSRVQGKEAKKEISEAIAFLNNNYADLDIILVGRGGGSIEDLWAFNTEEVAKAIFNSKIPIISCVGHETDFTIADFVADLRAPTPSAAAEIAVRKKLEIKRYLKDINERLNISMNTVFDNCKNKLSFLSSLRSFVKPHLIYEEKISRLDELSHSIYSSISKLVSDREYKLADISHKLDILSPLSVLKRGYAVCKNLKGETLKDISNIEIGDKVNVSLLKGNFNALVEGKNNE
jgi:exodeoxyribonuclease VII large subunit